MPDQPYSFGQRLVAIEVRLGDLGIAMAESLVLQAEFMTWSARLAQGGLHMANPRQALDFSERMLAEVKKLNEANKAFIHLLESRSSDGDAP